MGDVTLGHAPPNTMNFLGGLARDSKKAFRPVAMSHCKDSEKKEKGKIKYTVSYFNQ